jgi:hypothetical protein
VQRVSFTASLITLALTASQCLAAGWTQPQGKTQTILSARYYSTDQFFDNTGNSKQQNTYTKYEINPYAEYGLTDAITLGANLFLAYVSQDIPSAIKADNVGISDSEIFSRIRLYHDESSVFSLQPLIKFPSLYTRAGQPRSGGEQFDIELTAQGGRNFTVATIPAFTTVSAGYRHRFESPSDQLKLDWAVGAQVSERILLLPQISYTGRLNTPINPAFTQSGSDDYNLLKLQLSAVYSVSEDWSAELGIFDHTSGKNTGGGGGVILALWKQF